MLNKIRNFFKKPDTKSVCSKTLLEGETSSEFICECGKQKGWITENQKMPPCSEYGRGYFGYYDRKNLTTAGKETI